MLHGYVYCNLFAVIDVYANTIKYMFASGHDVATDPHAIGARLFSTVNPDIFLDRLFSTIASHASFLDRLFSTIASDASRQKIIFLRKAHGQGFGVAHLGFEQFLEARHKIFRWSSFDDFSNLRCKPNRPKSCQRSGSRQHHVYD